MIKYFEDIGWTDRKEFNLSDKQVTSILCNVQLMISDHK